MATPAPRIYRHFSIADVERMVDTGVIREDEHIELLDGELIEMPPQGPAHSGYCTRIHHALLGVYGAGFAVREAKPMIAGADQFPEPDIAVFRGSYEDLCTRHPRADEAVLVVEVAKTSLPIDRDKARIYATAGVPVYWIVDLAARRVEIHEDPQPDGRYRHVRVLAGDDRTKLPTTGVEWRIGDLLV